MIARKRKRDREKSSGDIYRIPGLLFGGVFLLLGGAACQNNAKPMDTAPEVTSELPVEESGKGSVLRFEEDSYNFGVVKEGQKIEHEYIFTNDGNAPLIIGQVTASCGCTTPEYSRKPIAPGKKGSIKVVFDSNGQVGQQHKTIVVQTNAKGGVGLLRLRGEVK